VRQSELGGAIEREGNGVRIEASRGQAVVEKNLSTKIARTSIHASRRLRLQGLKYVSTAGNFARERISFWAAHDRASVSLRWDVTGEASAS